MSSLETAEIVRASVVRVEEPIQSFNHMDKLARVAGITPALHREMISRRWAAEEGFNILVRSEVIVPRFRYAAGVTSNGYGAWGVRLSKWMDSYTVRYAGDIPDWALDRMERAAKVAPLTTIHSNSPLPVEIRKFEQCEPVLIAWFDNPRIILHRDHTTKGCDPTIGFVVAMWDMDKEITL